MKSPSILELVPTQGHGVFFGCPNQNFQGGGWNKSAIGLWTQQKKGDQDKTNNTQALFEKYFPLYFITKIFMTVGTSPLYK